jgi:hypothetical protein
MVMPSQIVQAAPNTHQLQATSTQVTHKNPQPQQLQPINATHALQMQQQKMQMNANQAQPGHVVGPATAALAQNRSQHIPMAQHQQYQQRPTNGGVPVAPQQQHAVQLQIQQQPPQYQQQRVNPNVRTPQYHQTQPVVMPTNSNNVGANQQKQQMQPQQIRQVNPQQRNIQYSQQQQHSSQSQSNPIRSIPTPTSQIALSSSPVPTNSNSHTPLYERLVTEEVKELKEYVRLIEQQSRRIADLEKIHLDLEKRLEVETSQRQRLEYTLQYRERYWKATTERLEGDRSKMENKVKEEKIKVERLLDMVNRLQNEIQSMIKNKFNPSRPEGLHGNVNSNSSGGGIKRVASGQSGNRSRSESGASGSRAEGQHQSNSGGGRVVTKRHIGPHELLACNGSAEAVRERNAFTSLLDFFGM